MYLTSFTVILYCLFSKLFTASHVYLYFLCYLFGVTVADDFFNAGMVEIPDAVEKFYKVVTRVREDDKIA